MNEIEEVRAVLQELPPGGTYLDVGANIGQFTRWMAKGADLVYAFEPHSLCFDILERTTDDLTNVKIFQLAVSDVDGQVDFWSSTVFQGHTTHKPLTELESVKSVFPFASTLCESVSLDQFAKDHDISDVRLLKIDVEGGEALVIKGAMNLLRNNNQHILLEVHQTADIDMLHQLLTDLGYQPIKRIAHGVLLRKQ